MTRKYIKNLQTTGKGKVFGKIKFDFTRSFLLVQNQNYFILLNFDYINNFYADSNRYLAEFKQLKVSSE